LETTAIREEHSLRVFKKKVLRRILAPNREKVKRSWRKTHN
jgi:hypothetical protein